MVLTGLGAYLGRFFRTTLNSNGIILSLLGSLAFIPVITVLGLHFLSRVFFTPGIMLGISEAFYFTITVLSPFCIISGMLFTLLANAESVKTRSNQIGSVYAWESVGSLAGGVLLNFILIWFLSTFQSLYLVMTMVVFITSFLAIRNKNYMIPGILVFVFLVFVFLFLTNNLDRSIREISYPSQTIEHIDETPYGIIVVTNNQGQVNYYENNVLIASSGDVVLREESVHYAMVQHANPKNVLVLSGIISGVIPEILKYPVKKIDYVDVNPGVIRLAKLYFNADSSKKLSLIENDPIRFLRRTLTLYDVVLINLPKPSTIQFNRFYTVEFFELLKRKLNSDAVVCITLPASTNYMNEETRRLLSIVTATIKTQFKNILILPGSEDFILASDNELYGNISKLIDRYGINNEYVNSFYIHDELLMERSRNLMQQIDISASKNLDFKPIAYQTSIKIWLSYFNFWYWLPAVIILLISVFFYFRANALNKAVFAAGFAGTSIELMLLFSFQILYGYVYFAAGVFIMIFMSGLAIGSLYWQKIFNQGTQKLLGRLLVSILIFSVSSTFFL
jgi:spermidine synthase